MNPLVHLEHITKIFTSGWYRTSFVKRVISPGVVYKKRTIIEDVSLKVNPGEVVGIVGSNGAGKTTLLKIIAGIIKPTFGKRCVNEQVVSFFSWSAGFLDDLEAYDNIILFAALLGLHRSYIKPRVNHVLSSAGLEGRLYDPLRTFSPGMKARLAFAIGSLSPGRIVLLDEVHAVGDSAFREHYVQTVDQWKGEGRALIMVSHDDWLIKRLSDRCFHLNQGRIYPLDGHH